MILAPARPGTAVRFLAPLPGFADDRDFLLAPLDPDGLLLTLTSISTPTLRFVLTPAAELGGYHPIVAARAAATLRAEGVDDVEVYVLLTAGPVITANLRAPICVARSSGAGGQLLLDDESLPLRHPLGAH